MCLHPVYWLTNPHTPYLPESKWISDLGGTEVQFGAFHNFQHIVDSWEGDPKFLRMQGVIEEVGLLGWHNNQSIIDGADAVWGDGWVFGANEAEKATQTLTCTSLLTTLRRIIIMVSSSG